MKIKFNKLFFIVVLIGAVLGLLEQFFLLVLAVFLHEISHILVAKYFGLKCNFIKFTPFGVYAKIDDIESLSVIKKILVIVVGPFSNLLIFVFCYILAPQNHFVVLFESYNLLLFGFNMLPIYPLDGSKIFLYMFSNHVGYLQVSKILVKISKFLSCILIVIGLLILVLCPFDIYFFALGYYLYKYNVKKSYNSIFMEFYQLINLKNAHLSKCVPIKHLFVNHDILIIELYNKLSLDNYLIFYYSKNEEVVELLESDLVKYVEANGLIGCVNDL